MAQKDANDKKFDPEKNPVAVYFLLNLGYEKLE